MVVEAGSFQAETFLSGMDHDRHETFLPNGGVFRYSHLHGFGQCSGSELLDAKRLAFAIESTVELS